MNLSADEIRWAELAVTEMMRRRRTAEAVPDPVRRLAYRFRCALAGLEEDTDDVAPGGDEINSRQAAAILGVSKAWVCRISADLDGVRVGRNWVFHRTVVQAYADARKIP